MTASVFSFQPRMSVRSARGSLAAPVAMAAVFGAGGADSEGTTVSSSSLIAITLSSAACQAESVRATAS